MKPTPKLPVCKKQGEQAIVQFIRKALWPTAIVAAFLMLFGALGSAVNADSVKGSVQTEKGGVVYVEVEVDSLLADAEAALAAAKAALATAEDAEETARLLNDSSSDSSRRVAVAEVRAAVVDVKAAAKAVDASNTAIGIAVDTDLLSATDDYTNNIVLTNIDNAEAPTLTNELILTDAGEVVDAAGEVVRAADDGRADDAQEDAAALSGVEFAKTLPAVGLDDYTVEIDDGTGSASIVATLKDDDGDADVDSNRATDSRTVTPVLVDSKADQEELDDYNVDADMGSYYVLVVVECNEFGSYDISFTNDVTKVEEVAELECVTDVASAVLSASASTIFTTTDKLTSKITVTLEDKDGDAAAPGDTVRFKTDNCEFADETTSKTTRSAESETVKGVTTAVVTLDCSEKSAKVGTATVSASVDRAAASDVYAEDLVVTLVGPATALTLTVTTTMADMVCGDVRQIDIAVVDTNGAAVANGTGVIVSTNFGGVLTGTTTGRFAPSSTIVSTTGGAASLYLITSDTQVGDYAVVASGGGSAVAHLTIACMTAEMMDGAADADAAAAITPPSTGNAGLAETSGSSWMLLAIAGTLASVMVAVGKGIPSFFRR
jgi:hypothetical protein